MKVRKNKNGKYRVYNVWIGWSNLEVRYAKKVDAEDFSTRKGGYVGWEDFDNEIEAQAYLDEKQGEIWW